jgi:hypothetical protein
LEKRAPLRRRIAIGRLRPPKLKHVVETAVEN